MGPDRPALRYYGGKWRIAPWIISHFPIHECYVEPYGGAASVLLRKPRSPIEVYNDLDGQVVAFFRTLRERPEELVRALHWTPWARHEYELCRGRDLLDDDLELARKFYVISWMGWGGGRARWRTGWRYQVRAGSLWKPSSISFTELEHLYLIAERLRGVQIECRPALDVIQQYDAPTTLFYLDPPYLETVRSKWADVYEHEMSDDEHEELALIANSLRGMVIISGYPSGLYQLWYERYGWKRVETAARAGGGHARTEALWLSPRTVKALQQNRQLALFSIIPG